LPVGLFIFASPNTNRKGFGCLKLSSRGKRGLIYVSAKGWF